MERESKRLIYKRATGAPGGETLQSALIKALSHYDLAANRVEKLGADESQVRFINVHRAHQNLTLGIFHRLTKGAGQYIISMADSSKDWTVELVTPPGSDEKVKCEFVEGTLFFAIWKNHVVLHQSTACRADQFQDYCSWLLSQPLKPEGESKGPVYVVELADPLPPDLRKRTRQPVKAIRFGSSIDTAPAQRPPATQKTRLFFTPAGAAWDGLKSILKDLKANLPDDLMLEDALGQNEIKVALELSCTKKNAASTAGEVLGMLGRALSHSEADTFEVELADGSKIRADQMKVGKIFRVECVQKQPVPEALFKIMVDWVAQLIEDKVIIEQEPFGNVK